MPPLLHDLATGTSVGVTLQGGAQPLTSCPLLGMHALQALVLQQLAWGHADVEALLALQRCFHVRACWPSQLLLSCHCCRSWLQFR